jgi:hypothetical protein
MRGKRGVLAVTFSGWKNAPGFGDLFSGASRFGNAGAAGRLIHRKVVESGYAERG